MKEAEQKEALRLKEIADKEQKQQAELKIKQQLRQMELDRKAKECEEQFQLEILKSQQTQLLIFNNNNKGNSSNIIDLRTNSSNEKKRKNDEIGEDDVLIDGIDRIINNNGVEVNTGFFKPKRQASADIDGVINDFQLLDFPMYKPVPELFQLTNNENVTYTSKYNLRKEIISLDIADLFRNAVSNLIVDNSFHEGRRWYQCIRDCYHDSSSASCMFRSYWMNFVHNTFMNHNVDVNITANSIKEACEKLILLVNELMNPSSIQSFIAPTSSNSVSSNPYKRIHNWLQLRTEGIKNKHANSFSKSKSKAVKRSKRSLHNYNDDEDEDDDDTDNDLECNEVLEEDSIANNVLIINGPLSTGKSSIVHACAADLHYNVVEIHASQYRNASEIKRICVVNEATDVRKALQPVSVKPEAKVSKAAKFVMKNKKCIQDEDDDDIDDVISIIRGTSSASTSTSTSITSLNDRSFGNRKKSNLILFDDVSFYFWLILHF